MEKVSYVGVLCFRCHAGLPNPESLWGQAMSLARLEEQALSVNVDDEESFFYHLLPELQEIFFPICQSLCVPVVA